MNNSLLKNKLNYHYFRYNSSQIPDDPIQIPKKFSSRNDIEVTAFISAVFAYGNVKQILKTLNGLVRILGSSPYSVILNNTSLIKGIKEANIHYRFFSNDDIVNLVKITSAAYYKFNTLENLFLSGFKSSDENISGGLENFSQWFLNECIKLDCLSSGFKFMFPLPSKGSAVKRLNLFLRWMVRKDKIDFGLWQNIKPNKLIIPLDTHIAKIARKLELTKRKDNGWKTALEITNYLKNFDKNDPVKYDFALCHIGMLKEKFL